MSSYTTYLTPMLYEHTKGLTTKIGKQVHEALNTESISEIVLYDNKYFYFEHNKYHDYVPESVYSWIINYLKKQGYIYGYQEATV